MTRTNWASQCLFLIVAFSALDVGQALSPWSSMSRVRPLVSHQRSNNRLELQTPIRNKLELRATTISISEIEQLSSPFLVAGVALLLGIAAQSFINGMLEGDQGLGAYLKDGSGYNKSGFSNLSEESVKDSDPLPWLKLPKLDFVEVAGQEEESRDIQLLEALRVEMNQKLNEGKMEEATMLREKLEAAMAERGIEYTAED